MFENIPIERFMMLGDQTVLDIKINEVELLNQLKKFDDKWSKYNNHKPDIRRDGLCIINEDGINKPGPALNSLAEWNKEHGTNLSELDFDTTTPVFEETMLKDVLGDIRSECYRSHFLRLPPGGYFPPHRDFSMNSFRVILPIYNCNPPSTRFMIEDKTLSWDHGRFYIINTLKEHTLFNASDGVDSIWLVLNVKLSQKSCAWSYKNMSVR
jgi:hypothetical protein